MSRDWLKDWQLNKQIGEVMGYRIEAIHRPTGHIDYFLDCDGSFSKVATRTIADRCWFDLPDWQHDIETALSLFTGREMFSVSPSPTIINPNRWSSKVPNQTGGWRVRFAESFAALPSAICELWLQVEADKKA